MTHLEIPSPIPPLEKIGTRLIDPIDEGPPDIIQGLLPRRGQLVISGETNIGKAMSLNTLIMTPNGWSSIGAILPGDCVFGSNGKSTKVIATSPVYKDHPCYRVTFTDGASCIVDANHEWTVISTMRYPFSEPKTLTTQKLFEIGVTRGSKRRRYRWRIELTKSLQFDTADTLPLDPYLLGVWLGDGTTSAGQITSNDTEIVDAWKNAGWEINKLQAKYLYGIKGLARILKDLKVFGNKHIPEVYMRASIEERKGLLAGLLDTDGWRVSKGAAEFCNMNKTLIDQVYELAIQLGCKVFRYQKEAKLYGKSCGTAYMLYIRAPFNPFRLPRKAAGFKVMQYRHVSVMSIEPVESVPVKCLVVDAADHLFLAGRNCIPTHNSLVALEICSSLITGTHLWGELIPTMQAKKILYILGEHYNEVVQRLWQVTGLPMTDQVFLLGPEQLGYDKWLVVQGKPNPIAVSKLQRWADGCDLVVFDPFSAFVTGVDVENDNIQMRLVLDTMSLVTQSVGASCIVLAHQGKPMIDKYGVEHSRKSYAIRGASAIEDAATNIFYMGSVKGTSAAAQETRDSKIFELRMRKYKGLAPEKYELVRDKDTLTHTLLGNRPFTEVRKMEVQAKIARIQHAFPDMKITDVYKILAASEGKHERTIRSYFT